MTKQEHINKVLSEPIKVGDTVNARISFEETSFVTTGKGKSKKTESKKTQGVKTGSGTVVEIVDDKKLGKIYFVEASGSWSPPTQSRFDLDGVKGKKEYSYGTFPLKEEWLTPDTEKCGADPFKRNTPRIDFFAQNIWQILAYAGYGKRNEEYDKPTYTVCNSKNAEDQEYFNCTYGGVNFDPYVIDKDGNRKYYQRGLVWNQEQKQLLIESIYNGIEIGKFVFRHHSWEHIVKEMKETGHGFDYDMVDGKQRMNALIEFVGNKYPDLHGNYFRDLSDFAQRYFFNYNKMAVGIMRENTKDSEVIAGFLTLNFTGAPMSKEHIEFVKSIKI